MITKPADFMFSVLVIFPHMTKKALREAAIDIKTVTIRDPGPDSFDISELATLNASTAFKPSISEMDVSISQYRDPADHDDEIVFARIRTPEVTASHSLFVTDRRMQITNMTEFAKFGQKVLHQEYFNVSVRAKAKVTVLSMHTSVDLQKTIVMKGRCLLVIWQLLPDRRSILTILQE
jgi:hypothetical protein